MNAGWRLCRKERVCSSRRLYTELDRCGESITKVPQVNHRVKLVSRGDAGMLGKHSKGLPTMARQMANSAMLKSFDVMLKVLDIWFVCLVFGFNVFGIEI